MRMASDLIVVFPLSIQKLYNFVRPSEKDIYNNCNKMLANTTNNASSNDCKIKTIWQPQPPPPRGVDQGASGASKDATGVGL